MRVSLLIIAAVMTVLTAACTPSESSGSEGDHHAVTDGKKKAMKQAEKKDCIAEGPRF